LSTSPQYRLPLMRGPFDGPAFLPFAHFVLGEFGTDQSWQANRHPRMLADVDGDGRADIVAFGTAGVYTAIGRGDGSFD
jgi:hypothetical protein